MIKIKASGTKLPRIQFQQEPRCLTLANLVKLCFGFTTYKIEMTKVAPHETAVRNKKVYWYINTLSHII